MTIIYRKLVHRTPSQWCNSNPYRLFCRGESGGCNPSQSIAATRVVFTTNRPRLFQGAPLAVQLTDPPPPPPWPWVFEGNVGGLSLSNPFLLYSLLLSIWQFCSRNVDFEHSPNVKTAWGPPWLLIPTGQKTGRTEHKRILMYSYELLLAKNAYQLIWSLANFKKINHFQNGNCRRIGEYQLNLQICSICQF